MVRTTPSVRGRKDSVTTAMRIVVPFAPIFPTVTYPTVWMLSPYQAAFKNM